MAENVRPPVAIRIVRPYDTEDALLENELETIGKTSVLLIGAHPRPTGVILRFEVTLASGATVLRGEGRVLAHKENAFRGQPGLSLRFTRLDPRSKAVVDRATAMREARAPSSSPSRPAPAPLSDPALADALTASTPAPGIAAVSPASDANERVVPASDPAPMMTPAQIAEEARARARAEANEKARLNATRTRLQLTPPPAPVDDEPHAADASAASDGSATVAPGRDASHDDASEASGPALDPRDVPDEAATPAPTPVTSIPGEVAEKPQWPTTVPGALTAVPPALTEVPAAMPVMTVVPPTRPRDAGPLSAPADKEELLGRLRERAARLPSERVEAILAARRQPRL